MRILVVSDGVYSNVLGGSCRVVKEYSNTDDRTRLIALNEDQGVANARNIGIEEASGRYIAFLDSDDIWYSNKLSQQLQFMQENNFAFTFTRYEVVTENGKRLNKVITAAYSVDYHRLLR